MYKNADESCAEVEDKRVNFLRSLAPVMATLENLTFTHIGAPIVRPSCESKDNRLHNAGPSYHFGYGDDIHVPTVRPFFSITQGFI